MLGNSDFFFPEIDMALCNLTSNNISMFLPNSNVTLDKMRPN